MATIYFTRWAEEEPIRTMNERMIVNFVFKNIVCRFGTPIQITINNGTQFTNKEMKKKNSNNEIKMSFASIYHPKTNGQVEATNKTILRILKRKVGENLGN